jgi:hypothetical protein
MEAAVVVGADGVTGVAATGACCTGSFLLPRTLTYTVVNAAMSAALPVRIAGTCCSAGFLP